jgi:hypothetical protein
VSATPKSLLRRLRGARGAALLFSGGRALIIVGAVGAAVWCGALARADTTPSPTTPTTTTDAPPPDPYQAPAKTTKQQTAPQHHAAVTHPAPVARLRSYTPAPVTPSGSGVRPTRVAVKPRRHAKPKPVRKHRVRSAPVEQRPISLAPLADLAAAIRAPLPVTVKDERQFPLPAGIALAVLAVAGTALLLLSLRVLRTGVGVR